MTTRHLSYTEALHDLMTNYPAFKTLGAGAYHAGLESTIELSRRFGHPHAAYRTVHVGGTNGKGTTSSLIASALQESGLRTGLYTSPHLKNFRERMRVDGEMISGESVADILQTYHSMRPADDFTPSFFELTTVMALEHFRREKVDVAVVEVGLGGRLDSTNIINPDLCVVTNISLDHTAILGDTIEQIAAEKGGIFKPGTRAIIGEAEAGVRKVFERCAGETGTPLLYASDDTSIQIDVAADGCVHVAASPFGSFDTALRGSYQTANVRTAISALASLRDAGYNLSDDAVARGFLRVADTLHGRWEMHNGVLCDSGHNEAAWRHTSAYLAERGSRITAIIGFCADKDVAAIADMLPSTVEYYCVAAHTPRAIPAAELQAMLAGRGLHAKAFASVAEAIEEARKKNAAEIFLGGSFYIVAEYL